MRQQLSIELISKKLKAHAALDLSHKSFSRQAAVAILLRENEQQEVEVLFIRRSERIGDPWSGHMAFPGGHVESNDQSSKLAAIRETWEEIGINLGFNPDTETGAAHTNVRYLGPLDHHDTDSRIRKMSMLIAPHVFELKSRQMPNLNYEVAEVVWTPLQKMFTAENHCYKDRLISEQAASFAGYALSAEHFVWGLTYRMLHSFFSTIDSNWQSPE